MRVVFTSNCDNVIRVFFTSQSIPIVPYVRTMSLEWLAAAQSQLLQSLCTTYLHFAGLNEVFWQRLAAQAHIS